MGWFRKSIDTTEHEYVEERLSAYLDGELSSQERAAVDRHLATCQGCQWNLSTLRQTVQWTRELPPVPVPRVFTIPASAEPARKARRRWGFVPLLQGATAVVALLLVFVVAGDFLLVGSMRPGSAPEPKMLVMEAPVEGRGGEREGVPAGDAPPAEVPQAAAVELTVVVELEKEAAAPAEPEAEKVVEKVAVEAEPSQLPEPPPAPTMEAAQVEEEAASSAVEATASLEADVAAAEISVAEQETPAGAGGPGLRATPTLTTTRFFTFTTPGARATRFSSAVRTAVPTIVALATVAAQPTSAPPEPLTAATSTLAPTTESMATLTPLLPTATPVEPTPTTALTLAPTATLWPTPVPQVAPPTLVAEAPPAAAPEAEAWDTADGGSESLGALDTSDVAWLRTIEFTLVAVLILLATITIVVMVRQRRAG